MIRKFTTERGFTLLEVLVAFSIFTVSLGILFQIFSNGTRSAILSDEYTRAVFIAQSRLASAGIEGDLDVGEYQGKENEIYRWTTTVRPYGESDDLEKTYKLAKREIEVTVNWNSLGKERSVKLNTLKLIPTS